MPMSTMGKLERAKTSPRFAMVVLAGAVILGAAAVSAQPAETAAPSPLGTEARSAKVAAHTEPAPAAQSDAKAAHGTPDATHAAPAGEHAAPADAHGAAGQHGAAAAGGHGETHGESIWVTLARIGNFVILAGILYWLVTLVLKVPAAGELARFILRRKAVSR